VKVLLVCGRHAYGDPARGEGVEYAAFVPALRALGHEVAHFESWNRSAHAGFAALNLALLEAVERERPAVMLTVQNDIELWTEALDAIRARGDVATMTWTTDDTWKYAQVPRFIAPHYHAVSTTYEDAVPRYRADGVGRVLVTQWAASSAALAEPLPAAQCRHRVSFVGMATPARRRLVAEIARGGIEVACFGYGWPAGAVESAEIPRIMRESVISLNFAQGLYGGPNQIKARTFEVPGAGGFLLTERAPGLASWYREGAEIAAFGSVGELCQVARRYLEHPEKRDRIARAGHERTRAEHTYERRLAAVLDFALAALAAAPATDAAAARERLLARARAHTRPFALRAVRSALVAACAPFGPARATRRARRLALDASRALQGAGVFSATGWAGRMFPEL
jgi:spore maturation protein CgeB